MFATACKQRCLLKHELLPAWLFERRRTPLFSVDLGEVESAGDSQHATLVTFLDLLDA